MTAMELVTPSIEYRETFQQTLDELRETQELGFWKELGSPSSIEEYIQLRLDHAEGRNLPDGWVSVTTYWLIDNGILLGETTIRHKLTEHLRNVGGLIGYWIRPSKRQQGYGTTILKLALEQAKALELSSIIITCDETNIASRKIIESNGGVFERAQDMGQGNPRKLLFWIEVS